MIDRDNPTPVELAHEHYLNHLARCSSCWAPSKRHCGDGLALRVEYDARYLLSLPDLYQRRGMLAREEALNPTLCEAIRARVLVLFEAARPAAQEVGTETT